MTGASPLCGSVMVRRTVGTDLMSRTIAVSTFFYFLVTNGVFCTASYLIYLI